MALYRLQDPSDGHLDEAHALRDRVGADLVHLIMAESPCFCGIAYRPGAFGVTVLRCGGIVLAHELGHNMGLYHDRFRVQAFQSGVSSHPASVSVLGSRLTVTPVSEGSAVVTVTATDTGGTNTPATQSFTVTVPRPFTDHPIVPGETPVRAVHFTELRARIDALRRAAGLAAYPWTDPVLTAGTTPVRLAHLLELRAALAAAYAAGGRRTPRWTDAPPVAGTTPIRAAHLMELRAAVAGLE